jgi:hypothetical protein
VLDAVLTGAKGLNLWASFRTPPPQRSARLYQALVNTGLASAVSGGLVPTQEPFLYTISVHGHGRHPARRLEEAVVLAEIDRVRTHGHHAVRAAEGKEPAARPPGVRERQHHQHRAPARLLRDDRGAGVPISGP